MKFEIDLFRFDSKSDYLPYYTKHFINLENNNTLLDIMKTIQNEDLFDFDESDCTHIVVNGIFVNLHTSLNDIYNSFGSDLQLDPISIKRASKDFKINDDDFMEKLYILSEFISKDLIHFEIEDYYLSLYKSFKAHYYASKTLQYEQNYIGDALILLAIHLIEVFPDKKNQIYKRIKEHPKGIQFHTKLDSRIFQLDSNIEKRIYELQECLGIYIKSTKHRHKNNKAKEIVFNEKNEINKIIHNFKDFKTVYLHGKEIDKSYEIINQTEIKLIVSNEAKEDLGRELISSNEEFTKKLVSDFLINCIDIGADFILVDNEEDFYLLDSNRNDFEKIVQRDINIPIIHLNEFVMLVNGKIEEVKKLFKKHTINPDII